ncbi:LysR family transcriptional regulator [Aliamphritea spongicola]|nr:LysR family transcriptional regulator [Aliamphritea spongicola]
MHLLTSRSILAFHLAAQENSFTKAADTLNVSQPAISHGVRQLEERLGVELLNVTRKGSF